MIYLYKAGRHTLPSFALKEVLHSTSREREAASALPLVPTISHDAWVPFGWYGWDGKDLFVDAYLGLLSAIIRLPNNGSIRVGETAGNGIV